MTDKKLQNVFLWQNKMKSSSIRCVLCDGFLPNKYDSIFQTHMTDQHRAFINDEFIFYASQIGSDKLEVYKHLMKSEVEQQNTEIDSKQFNGKVTITKLGDNVDIKNDDIENEYLLQETSGSGSDYANYPEDTHTPEVEDNQLEINDEQINENPIISPSPIKEKSERKSKTLTKKKKKKKERKIREREVLICDCDIEFSTEQDKHRHILVVHKKFFKCDFCKNGIFKKELRLLKHLKTHHPNGVPRADNSDICAQCGFHAGNKQRMYYHIRTNHDLIEQTCDICGDKVMGEENLRNHRRRKHLKPKKPQPCKFCGKEFLHITNHINTAHVESDKRRYKCEVCDKGFHTKDRLKNHVAIHSAAKPFPCRYECGFASKSAGNRTKHEIQKHKAKFEPKEIKDESATSS